jgi:two-component system, OmpR family, response regulator
MSQLERILVVEDEPDIQAILQMALEDLGGYCVGLCDSGAEALERAVDFAPDFILLDVMMPDLDGPATLQALRTLPALAQTPVAFITAQKRDAIEAHAASDPHVLGVLEKPFHPRNLIARIAELWNVQEPTHIANLDSERVAIVRQHFLSTLPARIAQIDAAWSAIMTPMTLDHIRQQAHQIGGVGATLGFARLSAAARLLEDEILGVAALTHSSSEVLTSKDVARIGAALDELRVAALASPTETPSWSNEITIDSSTNAW